MCIAFVYVSNEADPTGYRVVIANNRDEYYCRPTAPAAFWDTHPHCIGGLDLQPGKHGGTWMGVNKGSGKIGILTNIMEPYIAGQRKKSRGFLVTDFLTSPVNATDYMRHLWSGEPVYYGYNLVLLEQWRQRWAIHYYNNQDMVEPHRLTHGVLGVSNSSNNTPWQKVLRGKDWFADIIHNYGTVDQKDQLEDEILTMMTDSTPQLPDAQLQAQAEGELTKRQIRERSAIHFTSKDIECGTRTTTLLMVDGKGGAEYVERTLRCPVDVNHLVWDTTRQVFEMRADCKQVLDYY